MKKCVLTILLAIYCFQAQGFARTIAAKVFTQKNFAVFREISSYGLGGLVFVCIFDAQQQKKIEAKYQRTSETVYPYAHRWFKEFKEANPDAGFTSEVILTSQAYSPSEKVDWCAVTSLSDKKRINCLHDTLSAVNEACKRKYETPESFSLKDQQKLDLAEAILFHEMYHLLDQDKVGRIKGDPGWIGSDEDQRKEEIDADGHAMIHGSSKQIMAYSRYFAQGSCCLNINNFDFLLWNLEYKKNSTWPWEYKKREELDKAIKDRSLQIEKEHVEKLNKEREAALKWHPSYPANCDRAIYCLAAAKEKEALEARLAKETPEENEANLKKLLERGPRRSLPYSDTTSTARLQ